MKEKRMKQILAFETIMGRVQERETFDKDVQLAINRLQGEGLQIRVRTAISSHDSDGTLMATLVGYKLK